MEEEIDISYVGTVDTRLLRSLLSPKKKAELMERLVYSQDMNEIRTIHKLAEENQPIMGLEIIPQGQGDEIKQAIKYRVDRDNYYDRYETKSN